jgi:hypothetical protein
MKPLLLTLACTLASMATTEAARAAEGAPMQPAPAPPPERPLEIELGGDAIGLFGQTCRTSSDVIMCQPGATWAGFHLAPRWRVSQRWSLGIHGALAWRPSSEGSRSSDGSSSVFSQRLARFSGEARIHGSGGDIHFYLSPFFALGADARLVAMAFSRTPPALGADDERATTYGPQLGAALAINAVFRPGI